MLNILKPRILHLTARARIDASALCTRDRTILAKLRGHYGAKPFTALDAELSLAITESDLINLCYSGTPNDEAISTTRFFNATSEFSANRRALVRDNAATTGKTRAISGRLLNITV